MRSLYSDPASLNIARLYGTEFVPMVVRAFPSPVHLSAGNTGVSLTRGLNVYGRFWCSGAQSSWWVPRPG